MRIIIIGCEQAGKATLSAGIRDWLLETMGTCETSFHDHFLPWNPHGGGSKAEKVRPMLGAEDRLRMLAHRQLTP